MKKEMIEIRSDISVKLVQAVASDQSVVATARIATMGLKAKAAFDQNADESREVIGLLIRRHLGVAFEHNSMTFLIQAPLGALRECIRYRDASISEESTRYRQLTPVFYMPADDRKIIQTGRAGEYEYAIGTLEQSELMAETMKKSYLESYKSYVTMLDAGIAREVAAGVLPQNIYGSMFITMNARTLMGFLASRTNRDDAHLDRSPLREVEMIAEGIEDHFATLMPITYLAFNKHGRLAV